MRSLIGGVSVAGLLGLGGMALPAMAGALPSTGSIAGTVTSSSTQAGIDAVKVCATLTGSELQKCAETNIAGKYTIEGLAAGEYTIDFTGDVCFGGFCESEYTSKESLAVEVEAGVPTEEAKTSAELTPTTGAISGRVTTGGTPLAEIEVCASVPFLEEEFEFEFGGQCTNTNANGEYTIEKLAPSSKYKVSFSPTIGSCTGITCQPANYLSQHYLNQPTAKTASSVTVVAEKTTPNINAEMQPGGHISGKVTNASIYAQPIAGVEVCAASTATNAKGQRESDLPRRCALTNASGEYNIQALASSSYEVTFYGEVCVEPTPGKIKCTTPYLDGTYPGVVSVSAPGTTAGINGGLIEIVAAKPTVSAAPALTGTAAVGGVLSCSQGTWTNNPTSLTYRWLRNGSAIAGQSANTYTVQGADLGTGIACEVTATNGAGSTGATSNTVAIPKPTPGKVVVESASVKGATVTVTLRCTGSNACSGVVKLIAKVKAGRGKHRKAHSTTIGVASYSMALGKHSTLRVQLTGNGRKLLRNAGRKGLEVEVAGSNVQVHTVLLRAHRR
jgi:hypothetical protein